MARSSSLVERPVFRLLLLALMGLALASRLALGATLPGAGDGGTDPLAQLRAAMVMCHPGHESKPLPTQPRSRLLSDLLLFDQADNDDALASNPIAARPLALRSCALAFLPAHQAGPPPLWRVARPARGPPTAV